MSRRPLARCGPALAALLALASLLAAPAEGVSVLATLEQPRQVVAIGEELPFRLAVQLDCAEPPEPTYTLELHLQGSNAFEFLVQRDRWAFTASDCARGARTVTTEGTFRFGDRAALLAPLVTQQVRADAWLTVGDEVRAANTTYLRVAPDHRFLVGAVLSGPREVREEGGRLRQVHTWTVTNQGTGAFEAEATVHERPEWAEVTLATPALSDGRPKGAQANLTMEVSMPASCPAPTAVVTVAFRVRATDPRSHAGDDVRVQGLVPCDPGLAARSPAPVLAPVLALAAALLAARQHKR